MKLSELKDYALIGAGGLGLYFLVKSGLVPSVMQRADKIRDSVKEGLDRWLYSDDFARSLDTASDIMLKHHVIPEVTKRYSDWLKAWPVRAWGYPPVLGREVVAVAQLIPPESKWNRLFPALLFANVARLMSEQPIVVTSSIRRPEGDRGNHSECWALDLSSNEFGWNMMLALSSARCFSFGGFGTYPKFIHYDTTPGPPFRRWTRLHSTYTTFKDTGQCLYYNEAHYQKCRSILTLAGFRLEKPRHT